MHPAAALGQRSRLGTQPRVKAVEQRAQRGKAKALRRIGGLRHADGQRGTVRLRPVQPIIAMAEQQAGGGGLKPQLFGDRGFELFEMHRVHAKRPHAQHVGMMVVADVQDLVWPRLDPAQHLGIEPFALGLGPA